MARLLHPSECGRVVCATLDRQTRHNYPFRLFLRNRIHFRWSFRNVEFLRLTCADGHWLSTGRCVHSFHDDSWFARNGGIDYPLVPWAGARRQRSFIWALQRLPWLRLGRRSSLWLVRDRGGGLQAYVGYRGHCLLRLFDCLLHAGWWTRSLPSNLQVAQQKDGPYKQGHLKFDGITA